MVNKIYEKTDETYRKKETNRWEIWHRHKWTHPSHLDAQQEHRKNDFLLVRRRICFSKSKLIALSPWKTFSIFTDRLVFHEPNAEKSKNNFFENVFLSNELTHKISIEAPHLIENLYLVYCIWRFSYTDSHDILMWVE